MKLPDMLTVHNGETSLYKSARSGMFQSYALSLLEEGDLLHVSFLSRISHTRCACYYIAQISTISVPVL